MFRSIAILLLICAFAVALRPGSIAAGVGAGKKIVAAAKPPASKPKAPSASAAKAAPKKAGKDMTWGGRPDPTPELYVDPSFTEVPSWVTKR